MQHCVVGLTFAKLSSPVRRTHTLASGLVLCSTILTNLGETVCVGWSSTQDDINDDDGGDGDDDDDDDDSGDGDGDEEADWEIWHVVYVVHACASFGCRISMADTTIGRIYLNTPITHFHTTLQCTLEDSHNHK